MVLFEMLTGIDYNRTFYNMFTAMDLQNNAHPQFKELLILKQISGLDVECFEFSKECRKLLNRTLVFEPAERISL